MESASVLLERIFEPVGDLLTPDAAQRIVDWRIDNETQQRIDELADKSNEGTLSAEEAGEYDRYLSAFDIVAILQARSRTVLEESANR